MAFELAATADSGATGNYWKITKVEYLPGISVYVLVSLYVSQKTESLLPIQTYQYNFPPPADETVNVLDYAYSMIKAQQKFAGSVDVQAANGNP